MSRKVLTPAAAMQIKMMYEELDGTGRRRYTQMQIAKMLMVSETTVFRALQGGGAYANLPPVPDDAAAEASLAKLQRMLREQKEQKAMGEQVIADLKGFNGQSISAEAAARAKEYLE